MVQSWMQLTVSTLFLNGFFPLSHVIQRKQSDSVTLWKEKSLLTNNRTDVWFKGFMNCKHISIKPIPLNNFYFFFPKRLHNALSTVIYSG